MEEEGTTYEHLCREYAQRYIPDSDSSKESILDFWNRRCGESKKMILSKSYEKKVRQQLAKKFQVEENYDD